MGTRRLRPVPDRPNRVILYLRVSALMGRGGEDFHSPDLQTAALRRHVAGLGLREVAVIDDIDVSGRTFAREGLDRIRDMVEAGQADAVAVYDLSRLGRNVADALAFIRWLRERRVSVISTVEKIDDSPEGQFILTQWLALAELYSNQIGRRWAEVIAHRTTKKGRQHGPVPPLGYRARDKELDADTPDRGPIPTPLAPAVVQVFQMYADGQPVSDIVRYFTAARGKPINRAAIKRMLANPFYIGRVRVHGQIYEGIHVPIVDLDVWDRVQQRLKRDAVTPARRLNVAYALSGLVFCPYCERPMLGDRDPRGLRRLVCQSRKHEHGACQGPGTPLEEQVEAAVLVAIERHINDLAGNVGAQAERMSRRASADASAATVEHGLADVRSGMAKTHESWRSGTLPDWLYEQDMKKLRADEERLSAKLAELRAPQLAFDIEQVVSLGRRMLEIWPDALVAERHRLMKMVVRRVWVRRMEYYREPVHKRVRVDFW